MNKKLIATIIISAIQIFSQASGMILFTFNDIQTNPFQNHESFCQALNKVDLNKSFTNNLISSSEDLLSFVAQDNSLMDEYKQFILLTKLHQLTNSQNSVTLHPDWQKIFDDLPNNIKDTLPEDIIIECTSTDSETEDCDF